MSDPADQLVIMGRALLDYVLTGSAIEPEAVRCDCDLCGTELLLSPNGAARAKQRGTVVLCRPCLLTEVPAECNPEIQVSPWAQKARAESEGARRSFDRLMNHFGKGDKPHA